jgi:predicted nucleic acid-binding protein
LIISATVKSGATRILSEDLNAGQRIAGILIENPFQIHTSKIWFTDRHT